MTVSPSYTAVLGLDTNPVDKAQFLLWMAAIEAIANTVPGTIGDMLKSQNLSGLANYATARSNLGLATVAATGAYSDLTGKPSLATVATSGSATDLSTGTLPAARLPNPGASALGGVKSASGSAGQFMTGIDTSGTPTFDTPAGSSITGAPDIIIEEQFSSGTGAGTFTSGSYQKRPLNTIVRNNGSHASLSSNQVTLDAGTYYVQWTAPVYSVNNHQSRLQNVSDSTTVAYGSSAYATTANGNTPPSSGAVVFTIASSKTFELQHRCASTQATVGLGNPCSFGNTEVYARIMFTKIA